MTRSIEPLSNNRAVATWFILPSMSKLLKRNEFTTIPYTTGSEEMATGRPRSQQFSARLRPPEPVALNLTSSLSLPLVPMVPKWERKWKEHRQYAINRLLFAPARAPAFLCAAKKIQAIRKLAENGCRAARPVKILDQID